MQEALRIRTTTGETPDDEHCPAVTVDARAYQYAGALHIHAAGGYSEGRASPFKY
jgi:hypothetical protein